MRTQLTLMDKDGNVLHHQEIVGGFDLASTVHMAIGRTNFEMDRKADMNWTTAQIVVTRWDV